VKNTYFPLFSGKVKVNIFTPACFWLMLVSEGVAAFACLFAGVLIHELGHAFFIWVYKQKINSIEILPFGALISHTTDNLSFEGEKAIAAGGILFNLLAAFFASVFLTWFKNGYLLLFVLSNLFFAVINIVPLKTNDGGRLFYIAALNRHGIEHAEKVAKYVSAFGTAMLLVMAVFILYISGFNNGLCVFFLLLAIPK
jgi:stage IV sporulation protein FB